MTLRQCSLLFLFTLLLTPLSAQDEVVSDVRVAVLPLWFQEDDNVGPVLSSTVQNTIQWTLRFIDKGGLRRGGVFSLLGVR